MARAKDMSDKTWVYHETEKAKIVTMEEAEELYKDGWADTPAAFKEDVPQTEDDPTVEVEPPVDDDETENEDEPEDDEAPADDAPDDIEGDTGAAPEEAVTGESAAPEGESGEAPQPEKQISHMNVAELTAVAESRGINISDCSNKAQMRNAINSHKG